MASIAGPCDTDSVAETACGPLSSVSGANQTGVPAIAIAGIVPTVLGKSNALDTLRTITSLTVTSTWIEPSVDWPAIGGVTGAISGKYGPVGWAIGGTDFKSVLLVNPALLRRNSSMMVASVRPSMNCMA